MGKGHNRPADWWSLGILVYEMLSGIPPFYDQIVQTMYKKILKQKVVFKSKIQISDNCRDFILKLLEKHESKRLGSENDSLEVLSHPWFEDLDWMQLLEKKVQAPFLPEVKGDAFLKNFDSEFTK